MWSSEGSSWEMKVISANYINIKWEKWNDSTELMSKGDQWTSSYRDKITKHLTQWALCSHAKIYIFKCQIFSDMKQRKNSEQIIGL